MSQNFLKIHKGVNLAPQSTEPSSPADGDMYFDSTTSKFRTYQNGIWKDIGSGGGEVNFFDTDNDPDSAVIGNWRSGNNATFLTAGASNATLSTSSTAIDLINGTKAFKWVGHSIAGNNTNEWVASPSGAIPIPQGYRGQNLAYKGRFRSDATSGNIRIVIWDETNGAHLEPVSTTFEKYDDTTNGTSREFSVVFGCPSDCANIAVGFQVLTGESSTVHTFDDLVITPDAFVAKNLVNMSDWTDFTPTGSWTTNTTYEGKWRRAGDMMEIVGRVSVSGSPTATVLSVNIPSGYTIDTNKLPTIDTNSSLEGSASCLKSGGFGYALSVRYNNTTSFNFFVKNKSADATYVIHDNITNTKPFTWTSGSYVNFTVEVPIVGWNSESEHVIAYNSGSNNGQIRLDGGTGYGSTATKVRRFTNYQLDGEGSFATLSGSSFTTGDGSVTVSDSAANGTIFTINKKDIYHVTFTDVASASAAQIGLTVNASSLTTNVEALAVSERPSLVTTPGATSGSEASFTLMLQVGDVVRAQSDGATNATDRAVFNISRIGAGQLLGVPVQKIAYLKDVKASGTPGGTFSGGAPQTRTLNTVEGDSSIVSLSSNQFTLQPGDYIIKGYAPAHSNTNTISGNVATIYDITNSAIAIQGGNKRNLGAGGSGAQSVDAVVVGKISISSVTIFELRHECTTGQAGDGFGSAANFGENEVYSVVEITKLQ